MWLPATFLCYKDTSLSLVLSCGTKFQVISETLVTQLLLMVKHCKLINSFLEKLLLEPAACRLL